jgi:hypothetical protein
MVAGTNVLGSGFVLIAGWRTVGLVLWVLWVLWVLAALLAAGSGHAEALLFVALSASMVGLLVYLIVISLVCLRW